MSVLPPLAISTARCRKCGFTGNIGIEWQPSSAQLVAGEIIDARTHGDDGEPGWMLRVCFNCGYKWAEAVL